MVIHGKTIKQTSFIVKILKKFDLNNPKVNISTIK